jgi:hypothetical protein
MLLDVSIMDILCWLCGMIEIDVAISPLELLGTAVEVAKIEYRSRLRCYFLFRHCSNIP